MADVEVIQLESSDDEQEAAKPQINDVKPNGIEIAADNILEERRKSIDELLEQYVKIIDTLAEAQPHMNAAQRIKWLGTTIRRPVDNAGSSGDFNFNNVGESYGLPRIGRLDGYNSFSDRRYNQPYSRAPRRTYKRRVARKSTTTRSYPNSRGTSQRSEPRARRQPTARKSTATTTRVRTTTTTTTSRPTSTTKSRSTTTTTSRPTTTATPRPTTSSAPKPSFTVKKEPKFSPAKVKTERK